MKCCTGTQAGCSAHSLRTRYKKDLAKCSFISPWFSCRKSFHVRFFHMPGSLACKLTAITVPVINPNIRHHSSASISSSRIQTKSTFFICKCYGKICLKSSSKNSSRISMNARRNIHRCFIRRSFIHMVNYLFVIPGNLPGESNAENSVYYNSIFIPYRVIHYRYLVAHGNIPLMSGFFCHFIRISCKINLRTDSRQMQKSCNGNAVTSVIARSADGQNPFFFQISRTVFLFQIFPDLFCCGKCRPLHENQGGNMHIMNSAMVKQLHLTAGYNFFHKATPNAKLPPGLL